jgi:hypothetical protein
VILLNIGYLIIEKKRKHLIEFASNNGLSCEKSIKISQNLDHLLNLLNQSNITITDYYEIECHTRSKIPAPCGG